WTLLLGTPIILFVKQLGANALQVGLVLAFFRGLMVLQLFGARFAETFGYRRMLILGWFLRGVIACVIAYLALVSPGIAPGTAVTLVLALLFLFNSARCFSLVSWIPWISMIIPKKLRGRFFALRGSIIEAVGIISCFMIALILGADPDSGRFALLFFISAGAAIIGAIFLIRSPGGELKEKKEQLKLPFIYALKKTLEQKTFIRYIFFEVLFWCGWVAFAGFSIVFARDVLAFNADSVVYLVLFRNAGAILS
ncbi:unnamed protein product, partial [marine sediment metagenome]